MRAGRARRGFTVLEVAVTVALTATVFAFALPWVTSVLLAAGQDLDDGADHRQVAALDAALDRDLGALVTCPATGTPVVEATATDLVVLVSDGRDAVQVTWALQAGTLTRSQVPATVSRDGCGPTDPGPDADPPTWDTYATGVVAHDRGATWAVHAWTHHSPTDARAITVDLTVGQAGHLARTFPLPAAPTSLT